MRSLADFVRESNRIEGIMREPTREELAEMVMFLERSFVEPKHLMGFVKVYQPGAELRVKPGMNVRVGNHVAPKGGKHIFGELMDILDAAMMNTEHPYIVHHRYETLHPFMDGNGRSGRALWAWQMLRFDYRPGLELGFLHAFYYQSLEHGRVQMEART